MFLERAAEMVLPMTNASTDRAYAPPPTKSSSGERCSTFRKEMTVVLGEFVGTFMFLFMAFAGTQITNSSVSINPEVPVGQNPSPEVAKLLYISFAFGASLAINVAIFADVSGGMFNPAITTALYLTGATRWTRALLASTAQLVPTILMLPASNVKPMYIGTALFVSEICGVYYTGGSPNAARSFGPDVINGFQNSHWIYWVGPVLGAGLGSSIFGIVKLSRGETRLG